MPVMCYICGREFGSVSINIHIPQCEKKWDIEQQKLPKKHRRPPPTKPFEFDKVVSGELKGKDLQAAMEEYNNQAFDDFNKKALLECKNCGRTFLPRPLEIHQRACRPGTNLENHFKRQPQNKAPAKLSLPVRQPKKSSINQSPKSSINLSPKSSFSLSPEANNNDHDKYHIRPGTYKKSGSPIYDDSDDHGPSRADIIALVERDVAFTSIENRKLLMGFIKKICQAP